MEFPYKIRKEQENMIRDIERCLNERRHIVIEAPTGFGKTISSLYPSIKYAREHGKKIIYLVRTNSQEMKVIEEAKKLNARISALQGRTNLCPLVKEDDELKDGTAEELSRLCSKLKKEVIEGKKNSCIYYANYLEKKERIIKYIEEGHAAEEVFQFGYREKICPYEAIKDSLENSLIVVLPYIYFLLPFMRRILLDRMNAELGNILLIVDEAHNLPALARELRSEELSINSLEMMERECMDYGNPVIMGNSCMDIAEYLKEGIYKMKKFVEEEDGIIPPYDFEEKIAGMMKIGINDIHKLGEELIRTGENIKEDKVRRRKLPRSYIYHAGYFLYFWKNSYSYEYLRLIKWGNTPRIEIFCLDPSILTDIFRNVHSSIHMSGTLKLREYRDVLNLPEDTMLRRYKSPFSEENLKIFYVKDATTRYSEIDDNVEKIGNYIEKILKIGKNTAIFFPSYSILKKIMNAVSLNSLVEERGMKQHVLFNIVDKFRKEGGSILSVFGGRLSEGLDFPGKQLEIVVIAGIPYPKPTARVKALERYYDYKFGRGWDYVFKMPAEIKMRQAIGRLIRSEEDRGVAVILDKRAIHFRESIPAIYSEDIVEDIGRFFNG